MKTEKRNLEVTVQYRRGGAAVEKTARNDDAGREEMARYAFRRLEDPSVLSVRVHPTDRIAQTGRKSYR